MFLEDVKKKQALRLAVIEKHAKNGVRFVDEMTAYIDERVVIGEGTVIGPCVTLEGSTEIGRDCFIGQNTVITNSKVGDRTEIRSSVITDSIIGNETKVGPFAYLRPQSRIGSKCKIGDFVEVKNSTVGEQTAIAHLTYVGDSDVGKKVNFGCGTVTVNYDGLKKQRCVIGDNCFIGCNTNLIAPVELGKGAYTAAGSTVTKDVPDYALAVERADLKVKEGYSLKKLKSKLFPEDGGKK